MTEDDRREGAREPHDLARLFGERANAGDANGLAALYEPDATLAVGDVVATGRAEIHRFYVDLLSRRSHFAPPAVLPAIRNGPLALTFAQLPNGTLSVEVARQQADGTWLWIIDQLRVPVSRPDPA